MSYNADTSLIVTRSSRESSLSFYADPPQLARESSTIHAGQVQSTDENILPLSCREEILQKRYYVDKSSFSPLFSILLSTNA